MPDLQGYHLHTSAHSGPPSRVLFGREKGEGGIGVIPFALASLRVGGHRFDAILAHPAVSLPTPQRLPSAEENRWFSEEVYVHEPSLRAYLRTQYPFAPDIDDVVQESFLRLWRCAWGSPSAMRRRSCSRGRGTS